MFLTPMKGGPMWTVIIIVLVVLLLTGGGWGYSRRGR